MPEIPPSFRYYLCIVFNNLSSLTIVMHVVDFSITRVLTPGKIESFDRMKKKSFVS